MSDRRDAATPEQVRRDIDWCAPETDDELAQYASVACDHCGYPLDSDGACGFCGGAVASDA